MAYLIFLVTGCFLVGLVGVAANPSPFYGVVGLVIGALAGCGMLVSFGCSFIGLVLFLIYLGGMLVVFAYSVALGADVYPETWGDLSVLVYVVGYLVAILLTGGMFIESGVLGGCGLMGVDFGGWSYTRVDFGGVVLMFSAGGGVLLLCAWGLLLALFVVLELTRGRGLGSLRVP
uniref:NADH-ubiquinone oxidoreductase chain 6 n=1 Tax=Homonota fasciata TaxID=401549 RepID=A0A1Y1CC77_9SAUR|nr:NADH dehydrogenase subunit 6 [Homonota fasciata]